MSHVRTQIRRAAVAALTGLAPVKEGLDWPLAEEGIPLILVSTRDEELERGSLDAYSRTLDLVVEAVAKGPFVDDGLDALISTIEAALNQSKLGGLCKPLLLKSIAVTTERGAQLIGRARMTYRCVYFTSQTNPASAI